MNMKAHIFVSGDWSVGIPDWGYEVEIPQLSDYDKETREWLRKELEKLYCQLEDTNRLYVYFDDECVDCGQINCKGECLEGE